MAIVFTDWENATEGGTPYVLDWTDVDAMRASDVPVRFYIEAVTQALNERLELMNPTYHFPVSGAPNPLPAYPSGQHIISPGDYATSYASVIADGINNGLLNSLTKRFRWVNYLDNGGSWNNVVQDRVPQFVGVGDLETELGIPWDNYTEPGGGQGVAEWLYGTYRYLDALRWTTIQENVGIISGDYSDTDIRWEDGTTWGAAVTKFNAAAWGAGGAGEALHFAGGGTGFYDIQRRRTTVTFSGIPTTLSHQLQWYRKIYTVFPGETFENNDFVSVEDSTQLLHTGTVNSNGTEVMPTIGDYGNNSMSQPAVGETLSWWMPGRTLGSDVILKWDKTGGFTFVT